MNNFEIIEKTRTTKMAYEGKEIVFVCNMIDETLLIKYDNRSLLLLDFDDTNAFRNGLKALDINVPIGKTFPMFHRLTRC